MIRFLVTTVAGVLVGVFVGWLAFDRTPSDAAYADGPIAPPHQSDGVPVSAEYAALSPPTTSGMPGPPAEPSSAPSRAPVADDDDSRRAADDPLFSDALLAHYREHFQRGWLSARQPGPDAAQVAEGEREFRAAVLAMPAQLGARHADEQNERDALAEALAEGNGIALIAAFASGEYEGDRDELVGEVLDATMEPKHAAGERDGEAFLSGDEPLTQGVTIRFGAGVFDLDERRLRGEDRSTIPSDVTIVGAGMDSTLLRVGDISIREHVERLRFRDLTIDAENDGMFDLRTGAAVLDLERVRLVRFDAAHGGCYAFSVREGVALRARNCEIIGGYGRSPGNGNLFRSPATIARFEDCRFELIRMRLPYDGEVLFQGCSFRLMGSDPRAKANESTRFVNCSFADPLEQPRDDASLAKDLGDLFWQVKEK